MSGQWIVLLFFTGICATASSIPERVGGYTSYIFSGLVVWVIAAIMLRVFLFRKRESTIA